MADDVSMLERNAVIKWLEDHAKGHEHGGEDGKADVLREKAQQIRRGEHLEGVSLKGLQRPGARCILKDYIMAAWGWQRFPPPARADEHVPIKNGTKGHIIEVTVLAPNCQHVTVDYIDERNVLCRTVVEDQYVHVIEE